MKTQLNEKIIKRLTLYHFILSEYAERGLESISSPQIADLLKIDNSQIRKDIKLVKNVGKCKIGYEVKTLKKSIESALGFEQKKDVFIVGAGNLGTALLKYDDLKDYGLNILALFDIDPLKVGITINAKNIFHVSKLPDLAKRLNVETVILTVPKDVAQDSTEYLCHAGIKYIWNFAPRVLKVPSKVKVWNENLIGNFLQFIMKDETKNDHGN